MAEVVIIGFADDLPVVASVPYQWELEANINNLIMSIVEYGKKRAHNLTSIMINNSTSKRLIRDFGILMEDRG